MNTGNSVFDRIEQANGEPDVSLSEEHLFQLEGSVHKYLTIFEREATQ